jgi:hypothetical protein
VTRNIGLRKGRQRADTAAPIANTDLGPRASTIAPAIANATAFAINPSVLKAESTRPRTWSAERRWINE